MVWQESGVVGKWWRESGGGKVVWWESGGGKGDKKWDSSVLE